MENAKDHIHRLLKDFDTAMLISVRGDGSLTARPMMVAEITDDDDLWFVTQRDTGKADEIRSDNRVAVAFQGKDTFVTITGLAELVDDGDHVHRLWREAWRVWFPGGRDDPGLCLIRVKSHLGEYWDQSGTRKLGFLIDAGRAYLKREKAEPRDDERTHGRVILAGGG